MEWLDDSKACLTVAKTMLTELEELMNDSIRNPNVIPFIKVKIKNCLENCRSPLDYAANYIFDTYCKSEYTERELKRKKIYFPIRKQEPLFNVCIREDFRKLITKKPDLVDILKKFQSFNGDLWLQQLTSLINENKHRNLSKHVKEKTTHVKNIHYDGVTIGKLETNAETPLQIGDTKIDFINPCPYDYIYEKASVKIEYFFTDLNLSVIPTLEAIYKGSSSVILELQNAIEGR